MKIYFGAVPSEFEYDTEGAFTSNSSEDTKFYYMVEFGTNNGGTDEFVIQDSVGRFVPIDMENVSGLAKALTAVVSAYDALQMAESVQEVVFSETSEFHYD